MIITLKGCTATAFIGGLNFFKVSRGTVSGAVVTIATSTINKDEATSTSARELATVVLNSNYENLVVTVTMGGTTVNWYADGKVTIPANTTVTGDIKISASATAINTGGDVVEPEPENPSTGGDVIEPENPSTGGGETTNEYLINFDFTQNNLNDYSLDGTFEIPGNSTVSDIVYSAQGMNLNNNLPNGLILTTPVDASKAWTLEFTGTFVKPTVLAGNRRALLGGDNLTPFVFMNGNTVDAISFQVSAGSHVYTSASNMIWDSEVTYKFIYNGSGSLELYVNNELKETKTINYTGNFVRILGNIEGKSSAYIWQDVESGKQSWLKTFKFKYND